MRLHSPPFGARHPVAERMVDRHVVTAAAVLVLGVLGTLEFAQELVVTRLAVACWVIAAVAAIDLVAAVLRRMPDPPDREH